MENIRGHAFEDFAMAFLREEGYQVHESGESGPDGGWDARVELGNRRGIAHASTQKTWKRKLRNDAEKVKDLEDEQKNDYELLVFVTNQDVGGEQELDMEEEIRDAYGWTLNIHHRKEILGELRQNAQRLASDFLDIDLQKDQDHIEEIEELCNKQLDTIQARNSYASDLIEGPTIILHIIPNGVMSKHTVRANTIPEPSVLFERLHSYSETKGKYTICYGGKGSGNEKHSYAVLRNDGLYESASVSAFIKRYDELWLQGFIQDPVGLGLDAHVVLAARSTMQHLADMGFSGPAFVWVSLLDAADVQLAAPDDLSRSLRRNPMTIDGDQYTTEHTTLQIGDENVIEDLEPILDELWREFGADGTPNIEDGQWARGNFRCNGEKVLSVGDR